MMKITYHINEMGFFNQRALPQFFDFFFTQVQLAATEHTNFHNKPLPTHTILTSKYNINLTGKKKALKNFNSLNETCTTKGIYLGVSGNHSP